MKRKPREEPTITVNIKFGPTTLAQKIAWRRFWQELIIQIKENESKDRKIL